jgi:hypothetical protein
MLQVHRFSSRIERITVEIFPARRIENARKIINLLILFNILVII